MNNRQISTKFRLQHRNNRGSILIVGIIGLALILGTMVMISASLQTLMLQKSRSNTAVQSAALAVAGDLSRIVVKDADWGYIALCDHPAAGKATMASDGEALPILGINSVTGTVRLERLLAKQLHNDELQELAQADVAKMREVTARLQRVLDAAVDPSGRSLEKDPIADMNGVRINAYSHAKDVFIKNTPELASGKAELVDFKIKLGVLNDASSTMTLDPERETARKYYPAFVNVPVDNDEFYFAGLSEQPRLIDPERLAPATHKEFRSAIVVEATIACYDGGKKKLYDIRSAAGALPFGNVDRSAPGSLALSLPQGSIKEANCLRTLLESSGSRRSMVQPSRATGGDYPAQSTARLVSDEQAPKMTLSSCTGRAIFDWLRTTHARVRLSSVMQTIELPFTTSSASCNPGTMLVYDFDKKGNCVVKTYSDGGFAKHTVSDGQNFVLANNVAETEKGMLGVSIRDQVANLGAAASGQHGGQPILSEMPVDYSSPAAEEEDIDKSTLRKSYRKGGLAVAIELFLTPKS